MTPRCKNYLDVIDALDTKHPAPDLVEALSHMCAACALRPTCWEDNKRQQWLVNVRRWRPTPELGARQQRRVDALEDAAAEGRGLDEVVAALGTTATALREWCRKYGRMHLWKQLEGGGVMSTTCALRQQRGADSWENHKHVSKTPATAGTARGHGRSTAKGSDRRG